jgi:hypothetical protein
MFYLSLTAFHFMHVLLFRGWVIIIWLTITAILVATAFILSAA